MDDTRFDALTRSLSSRRTTLGGLLGGLAVLVGVAEPEEAEAHNFLARCRRIQDPPRRRACIRRARAHNRRHQAPPPPPPCANGVKDGSETDVDCGGGTCPRCSSGKGCAAPRDCTTGRCVSGTCRSCSVNDFQCSAGCFCQAVVGACITSTPVESGKVGCTQCPPGTICQGASNGTVNCHLVCGS